MRHIADHLWMVSSFNETTHLKLYWIDLHQIFRIGRHVGGMIILTFVLRSLIRRCYGNQFSGRIDKNWNTQSSFVALAFDNGLQDGNA